MKITAIDLKKLRLTLGLTQAQAGKIMLCSSRQISRMENGRVEVEEWRYKELKNSANKQI